MFFLLYYVFIRPTLCEDVYAQNQIPQVENQVFRSWIFFLGVLISGYYVILDFFAVILYLCSSSSSDERTWNGSYEHYLCRVCFSFLTILLVSRALLVLQAFGLFDRVFFWILALYLHWFARVFLFCASVSRFVFNNRLVFINMLEC